MMANLFPILVNGRGKPTEHVFCGFVQCLDEGDNDLCRIPMFRCSETGEVRQFGYLGPDANVKSLYGTNKSYAEENK